MTEEKNGWINSTHHVTKCLDLSCPWGLSTETLWKVMYTVTESAIGVRNIHSGRYRREQRRKLTILSKEIIFFCIF